MTQDREDVLPDAEQRKRITTELDLNMLVEAAAGTGKTTMLLKRMVELIRTGRCERISRLAAITFTRKAAAELRSRFQGELEKAASRAEGEERARLGDALGHIEQCFIGTIHSFCTRLLRERPLEAGIDIAFEELDDSEEVLLGSDAWEEFAAIAIADDPGGIMERLEAHGLEFAHLKGAFKKHAESHDVEEWPAAEPPPGALSLDVFDRAIRGYVEHMETVGPTLPEDDGKPGRLKEKYRTIPIKYRHNEPLDMATAMEIIQELGSKAPSMNAELKKALSAQEKDLVKREQHEWTGRKESMRAEELKELWYGHRYAIALEVLEEARRYYDRMREDKGVLSFQDLLIKAAALLRENPQVRRYFAGRYSHILVDEFQDTDPIQAEMMILLTAADVDTAGLDWLDCEPRAGSLFVVGDPKQSIYRFRRADIATYNLVKSKFDEWDGAEVLELSSNFRSTEGILGFVHDVFSDEFEPPGMATRESPSYVKLEKCRQDANDGELTGVKALRVPCDVKGRGDPLEEAGLVARFIVEAVESGRTVTRSTPDEGEEPEAPAACYGDFMIITYLKDELDAFAGRLQELGVPCRVSGSTELGKVAGLKMLLACLKAVAGPDNPVLLVAALRSELFGVSDPALYRFKKAGGRFDYRSELPKGLSDEDRAAFSGAYERLGRYSLLLARLPALAALERVAADLGLFALAGAKDGGDVAAGSIMKAIEILRCGREERWAVSQVIEALEEITSGAIEADGISALPEKRDAVQIMNLHKVKGLQAPVVILAGMSEWGSFTSDFHVDRSSGRTVAYMEIRYREPWVKKGKGSTIARPLDWTEWQEAEDLFAEKEKLRLRYVAATRPESMLVVSLPEGGGKARWCEFEDYLDEAQELEVSTGHGAVTREEKKKHTVASPGEAAAAIGERLARASVPTCGLKAAKEYALAAAGKATGPVSTPIEREIESLEDVLEDAERGVRWGTVIHGLLEIKIGGPAADLTSLAASLLEENELDARFAGDAVALVESVTRSGLWKRARASVRSLAEVPFSVMLEDGTAFPTLLRGKIDLVFKGDDGWVVVDYKTDRPPGGTAEPLVEKYAAQVRLYADAWKACTGEEVTEMGIFFVATGEYARV